MASVGILLNLIHNLVERHICAIEVGSIAERAVEIAPGKADKHSRSACEEAFANERVKYFMNFPHSLVGGGYKLLITKHSEKSLTDHILMVGVAVIGKRIDGNTAAGHKYAHHFEIFGVHQFYQILHDNVYAVLVEIAVIAETEKIEFQTLAFHHAFARDVVDDNFSEIRLSGFRTKSGKLRAIESDEIFVLRVLIRESFEHLRSVVVGINGALIAQKCNALKFLVGSCHNLLILCKNTLKKWHRQELKKVMKE